MKTLALALLVGLFGFSFGAHAQSADEISQLVEQQASQNINLLIAAGNDVKAGNDANACYSLGQAQTGTSFIALMLYQIANQGVGNPALVQNSFQAFATAANSVQAGAGTYCKTNNPVDSDRELIITSINLAGKTLAALAPTMAWTDISLN